MRTRGRRIADNDKGEHLPITKIGTKYLYIGDGYGQVQVEIKNLTAVSGSYGIVGKCYLTQEDYAAAQYANNLWRFIQERVRNTYTKPDTLSVESMELILKALDGTILKQGGCSE